jgi:hypothetical protein
VPRAFLARRDELLDAELDVLLSGMVRVLVRRERLVPTDEPA